MEQPEGYVHPKFLDYVCKLKKALYGLKQPSRAWTDRISKFLQSIGFVISMADYSYVCEEKRCKFGCHSDIC